ncbi:Ribosomal protein L34e superfamily protein [Trifolium repens]|nr:Ribosomal protein L34e superfamily protein [Trifolium repens]
MVYFHSSISLCKSVDQPPVPSSMANSIDFGSKSRQSNNFQRNRKNHNSSSSSSSSNSLQIPPCDRSRSAMIDVVIFIAVVIACGFLFYPYVKFLVINSIQIISMVLILIKEEFSIAPYIYISIGLSVVCAALATWGVVVCTTNKCGNPNCKGLKKAAEFDIQLETEDCVKNSPNFVKDGGVCKKGLFELPRDHHKELEAELKKMAPVNGRAVLVLRARCGCSVGRLEVSGPKKHRKIKK